MAEQFMTMLMSIISIFSAIPALILMLKLRSKKSIITLNICWHGQFPAAA